MTQDTRTLVVLFDSDTSIRALTWVPFFEYRRAHGLRTVAILDSSIDDGTDKSRYFDRVVVVPSTATPGDPCLIGLEDAAECVASELAATARASELRLISYGEYTPVVTARLRERFGIAGATEHDVLAFRDSATRTEVFEKPSGELVFLESANRVPGGRGIQCYFDTFGINLVDLDQRIKAGIAIEPPCPRAGVPSFWAIIPRRAGVVRALATPRFRSRVTIDWEIAVGETLDATTNFEHRAGVLLAKNDSHAELRADFSSLCSHRYLETYMPHSATGPRPSELPTVLLAESRRSTFTEHVMKRRDPRLVLLRFDTMVLDATYLEKTASVPVFVLSTTAPAEAEAARYSAWCREVGVAPTYFCKPNESMQLVAQRFARAAGLPALSDQQVGWVRSKVDMKLRYAELGIPHARHRRISAHDEVAEAARELGYPIIVKPIDSDSCIDTYRIDDTAGLARLPELSSAREWMVEEFIRGREYQLCAIVARGQVLDAYLSLNPAPLLTVFEGAMNANITLGRLEPQPVDGKAVAQMIATGMGIDRGYLHGEFFVREDGSFCMSEIAARLSGCEVPMNHGLARGFDFLEAIMDTYLERVPTLSYTRNGAVGDLLLPVSPGVVRRVSTDMDLLKLPGVIDSRISVKVGDALRPARASSACSGFVHVEGRDASEVEARMQAVLDHYVLDIEPFPHVERAVVAAF